MSFFDTVKRMFEPPTCPAIYEAEGAAGQLLSKLEGVVDPETGVDIVNMGFIRGLDIDDEHARIRMTLTTPGCPMASMLRRDVADLVEAEGLTPDIRFEFEPPWSVSHLSEQGRAALGR